MLSSCLKKPETDGETPPEFLSIFFPAPGQGKSCIKDGNSQHPFSGQARRKQQNWFFSEEVDLVN